MSPSIESIDSTIQQQA